MEKGHRMGVVGEFSSNQFSWDEDDEESAEVCRIAAR